MPEHSSLLGDRQAVAVPDGLDSPTTKLVYLFLLTAGPSNVAEVTDALGLNALSVYPVLDHLADSGFVDLRNGVAAAERRGAPVQR